MFTRILRRRSRPKFVVVWWPGPQGFSPLDVPELLGPFRSNRAALAVRDSIRRHQRREEKMAQVTVLTPHA